MNETKFVQIERRKTYMEDEFWTMLAALDARKWTNLLPPQLPIEDLPTKREKNFVTPADAPVPDCVTCGACCAFLFAVGVKPSDEVPPEMVWNVTDASGEFVVDCYLKRDAETLFCAALEKTASGEMPCRIYERRPQVCRSFEAGSDKCHAMRRIYGIEPFLTLQEMFNAQQILKKKESEAVSPETIRDVKIAEQAETEDLEIVAILQNGARRTIHTYDPKRESWRQFQFSGSTLEAARRLIRSQNETTEIEKV